MSCNLAVYDKSQRWYYYPQMQVDESMLIKTFDSATDGPTRFTIHTSFVDPSAPEDSPPRESIETRCLGILLTVVMSGHYAD